MKKIIGLLNRLRRRISPRVWSAAGGGALVAGSLLLPGIDLYCCNAGELNFRLGDFLPFLLCLTVLLALLLMMLQLAFRRFFTVVNAAVIGVGLLIWVQTTFLKNDFGVVDGAIPDWKGLEFFVVLELVILLALFVGVLWQRRWCSACGAQIAGIVLLAQLVPVGVHLTQSFSEEYQNHTYSLNSQNMFLFAPRDNVVLILMDAVGREVFQRVLESHPDVEEIFQDFNCFIRTISPTPLTRFAVPGLLSGVTYSGNYVDAANEEHNAYLRASALAPGSLWQTLGAAGYRREAYPFIVPTVWLDPALVDNLEPWKEEAISLRPWLELWNLRCMPLILKPWAHRRAQKILNDYGVQDPHVLKAKGRQLPRDLQLLQRMREESATGERDKIFKYLHFQGAHVPLALDGQMNPVPEGSLPLDEQVEGVLRIFGEVIRILKKLGVYDNALIVIAGDHSERYGADTVTLIKRRGETGEQMRTIHRAVFLPELAETIRRLALGEGDKGTVFDEKRPGQEARWQEVAAHRQPTALLKLTGWEPVNAEEFRLPEEKMLNRRFLNGYGERDGEQLLLIVHDLPLKEIWVEGMASPEVFLGDPCSGKVLYRSLLHRADAHSRTTSPICFRMSFADIPDGIYRWHLRGRDRYGELSGQYFFSSLIQVSGGQWTLIGKSPPSVPSRLKIGDDILLRGDRYWPQLDLIRVGNQDFDQFDFYPSSRLVLRLPEHDRALRLLFTVAHGRFGLTSVQPGAAGMSFSPWMLKQMEADQEFSLVIPEEEVRRGELTLRFQFQVSPAVRPYFSLSRIRVEAAE